ncbi:hypothetical protein BJ741DRAFT_604094 [Chytriomyces cf. hyalinus JEL632]|nr:hypothetical protein BJ741DRAFT_604094 [Chytriomyces cf. hyalinus JEL632]
MSRRARVDAAVSTANKENDLTPKKTSKAKPGAAAKPPLSAKSSNVQPSKNNSQPPLKNSTSKLRLMDSPRLSPLIKSNINNASFDAMRSGFSFDFGSALVDSCTYISSPLRNTHAQTLETELNGQDEEDPFGFFKADRDFDRFLKATANKSGNFSTSVSLQHQHQQQQNVSQKQETFLSNIASPKLASVSVTGHTQQQQQNILSSPSQKSISVSTDSSPMAPGQKKRVAWYEKSLSPAPKPKAVPKKKSVSKPKARSKAATIETDESGGGVVLGGSMAVGDRKRRSKNVLDRVNEVAADLVKSACAVEKEVLEMEGVLDQANEETDKETRPKKRQKKVVPVVVANEGGASMGRVTRSRARKQ